MRSRRGIVVPLVVVAFAVGMLMTPSASGQTVLHFVIDPQGNGRVAVVDISRDGLRLGDRIAARSPVFDDTRADHVGTAYLQCLVHRRIIDPNRGLWNCNYVIELTDGDIVLQGLDPRGSGEYDMSVLGGTGAYAGATGDATFTDVSTDTGDYTDMVIRLR